MLVRILHLEDDPRDAEIVAEHLAADGLLCEITRVPNRQEYEAALHRGGFDLILSDYNVPGFEGTFALARARQMLPATPFLFCSGMIGDERAIEALRSGATDYVLKDRLGRLASAVRRALSEVEHQRERQSLQEQIRQAQKMEAIGQLAGGVAHDFNNILTAILGYSEMIELQYQSDRRLLGMVTEIRKAGERAAALTRQLLAFSRKQILDAQVLDLGEVIHGMENMLKRLIGEDVVLETRCQPTAPPVIADRGQVEQVLMNLVVNARDALRRGGERRIGLEVEEVEIGADHAPAGEPPPGVYVMLTVRDTGTGMDAETRARIFEPFFTTKGVDKGTGLGLSTVYGIVKQSGGHIAVESEPGRGSVFRVYLPRAAAPPRAGVATSLPSVALSGSETVLLAEDDDPMRTLSRLTLERYGYTVLEAADGPEAAALAASYPAPIHLVLADGLMPGMTGAELARRVIELRPSAKLLLMSGYSEEALQGGLEGAAFLQKPFTPQALARRVREVLGET